MSIYRGPGGAGDAVADSSSEALLVRELAIEVQADADAAEAAKNAALAAQAAAELAETNAETAETNAETAETNAETAATAAASSASSASSSASAASTSATNAASSATAAASSASGASTSATNAASSATSAASSATSATSSKNAAATSATNAASSATAAASSATSAAASFDSFDDRYLGTKTSAPSVDNDGNALLTGALYFNSVAGEMFVWNGSSWVTVANSTSATNAANSATAAATSATNAANSATAAATSATNAASSATSASTSASTASTAATTATTQATNAATSATSASTSATNAATSATNAASSATSASASAAAASAVALGNEPVRHSVRPSLLLDFANTKTLDPRITFTRASTGTYYDGKTVAKAEENLLTRSQDFNFTDSWTIGVATTVTANSTTAPDGTTTADKIVETSDTGTHTAIQGFNGFITGASYTFSVFLKASERGFALFSYQTNTGVSVNLTTGTATSAVGSPTNITSTDAGNGWYRVSFTFSGVSATQGLNIYVSTDGVWANRSYAGTDGSGIFVWGAQLEQRSSVTAYTATTTVRITNYIPALQTAASGVARFEHNPTTGESLGLEIEEQRTNLVLQSETFDNASWTKTRSSITANTIIAPDGTLTGDKLIANTDNNSHFVAQTPTHTAAAHTFSFYAKAGEYSIVQINNQSDNSIANFDLSTGSLGTVTGYTATMTSVGNGWYRCTATLTFTASSQAQRIAIVPSSTSARLEAFTGDDYKGLYIWGAQFELGSFATSYIPTVASQVTRSADSASMTGTNFSSWYRADEGTLYAETAPYSAAYGGYVYALSTGTANTNTIVSYASSSVQNRIYINSSVTANLDAGTYADNQFSKSAFAFKTDDIVLSLNGGAVVTDTASAIPVVDRMMFGVSGNTAVATGMCVKKFAYYPKRLTNAELQGLTTV